MTTPYIHIDTDMSTHKKIVKPKGQEPDEMDLKVASELLQLEVGREGGRRRGGRDISTRRGYCWEVGTFACM